MLFLENFNLYTNKNVSNEQWPLSYFLHCLENHFGKSKFVEDKSYSPSKVNIFFVLASWIRQNLDWFNSVPHPKVIIEHDACMNFIKDCEYYNFWTNLHKETEFDLLVSSGKIVSKLFNQQGVASVWVAKGCPDFLFNSKNKNTGKIATFSPPFGGVRREASVGVPTWHTIPPQYKSRYEMLDILKNEFPDMPSIAVPYRMFAETVSTFSAMCLNDETINEPMAKHFECSAVGCVPIRDFHEELFDLGYNEESMIIYKDFDHMRHLIKFYSEHPEKFFPIQNKCVEITRKHTWSNRAIEIKGIINDLYCTKRNHANNLTKALLP